MTTTPPSGHPSGPQTITIYLDNGDGTRVTGTFTYDGTSGAPESMTITNTSTTRSTILKVKLVGQPEQSIPVPPGTQNFTADQLAAFGWTDVYTQLEYVTAAGA